MGFQNRTLFLIGLVCVALVARFLPHPQNFSPLAAIALFGGASFCDRRLAWVIPLVIMLVSDLFLGLHSTMPFVYGCLLFNVLLGRWAGDGLRAPRLVAASLIGSCVFFVVTNFGFWLMYGSPSWESLVQSYVQAIPFFRNTVVGDLFFSGILFGSLGVAQVWFPSLTPARHKQELSPAMA